MTGGEETRKVIEAAEEYGYTQQEVVDFLGPPFTPVSKIINQKAKCKENRPDPRAR